MPGADSPKLSIPITLSFLFKILNHEFGWPHSTTRTGLFGSMILFLYSSLCSKKISKDGIDTTFVLIELLFSSSAASKASCTSLPEATIVIL